MFKDKPEGQTHYCPACECEARMGFTNLKHQCGLIETCGHMILTPTPEHNGGLWCAEKKPCKIHPVIKKSLTIKRAIMNYWLISDTHFNHEKLTEWGGRSGDWQDQLWEGISKIPVGDTLIHLGDICIGDDEAVHERLTRNSPCTNILVRGNHDKKSMTWYLEHGWDFVCDGIEIIFQGHYLHLTHRPTRPQANSTYNIHGHTHGTIHHSEDYVDFYNKDYHIDISPELVGYLPIKLDSLMKKLKR